MKHSVTDRIKVLHVIKSLGRGGAETLLPETLKLHNRDQFEFHYIYFLPWKDQMAASIQAQGGRVTCFEAKNNFQLMLQAKRVEYYVIENGIQLIHAHLPWAGILARRVGKACSVPVIYTEHNKQERYHFATRFMNLLTMNALHTVVAVSDDVASSIRKHKRSLKIHVRTILNGVNTEHFQRDAQADRETRKALGIAEDALIVGTIAVFRFQKRLDLWMTLASAILKQFPEAHFILVGDGPLKAELQAKRAALGLENKIHMTGLQTEVRPYLSAFDVYLMSSIFEGLPIALLEAMSMSCAIVTTDAGGIKEVIRNEVDGISCSVDKPEALVDLTVALLRDTDLRQSYGKRARQRVMDSFSMRKMVTELESLYREILDL